MLFAMAPPRAPNGTTYEIQAGRFRCTYPCGPINRRHRPASRFQTHAEPLLGQSRDARTFPTTAGTVLNDDMEALL
jgi:hypothetical protein